LFYLLADLDVPGSYILALIGCAPMYRAKLFPNSCGLRLSGMARFLLGIGLFLILLAQCNAQTTAPDFSIIVLPDTQYYAQDFPQTFTAQTQWIVNNLTALNIKMVIGVGDIVNGGGVASQWQAASNSVSKLEGKVPYFFAIGNHDYDKDDPPNRTASTTNFNHYFGPSRYAHSYRGWLGSYPSGSNENFYGSVTIEGKRYLILLLEFYPRNSALQWASGIIQANPDAEVILVTHGYGYWDNTRVAKCETYDAEYYNMGADNDGARKCGRTWPADIPM
jgi:hypothetical protein